MAEKPEGLNRRRLMTTAAGSVAGVVVLTAVNAPAHADTRAVGGVSEVLRNLGDELVVKVRESGATLRVSKADFGMPAEPGDIVAVMPDVTAEDKADREILVARPYLQFSRSTGAAYKFHRSGEPKLVNAS